MADKVPVLRPRQVISALQRAGFVLLRQRGSHAHYRKGNLIVTVPMHAGDLKPGTFRSVLRQAQMSWDEFAKFL